MNKPSYEELEKRVKELEKAEAARKRIERNLKNTLKWYEITFEGSRDAVFISDTDSKFISVNNAACELTGYSKDELLRMKIPEIHEEVDLDAYNTYFEKIMAGEKILSEAKILRKDGTKVDTEFNNQRIEIQGKPYMHTVARDVSERKRTEEALRESEEKYRDLTENAPIGIYKSNFKGDLLYVNNALLKMAGFDSIEDMQSIGLKNLYENPKERDEFIKELKKTGKVDNFELELLKKDKQTINVLLNATVKDECLTGMILDITERKKAEDALRESEELYRITLSNISDAVFITKRDGTFTFVCPNVDVIFGYSEHEVQDLGNIKNLLGDNLYNRNELKTSGEIKNIERTIIDKAGIEHHLLVNVKRVDIKEGTVLYTCRDITEREKAEEALDFTQFAVNHMGDAAYWMGSDAHFIYVNDASCRALGYSHEELLLMTVHDISPEFPKSAWASHWRELRKRKTFTFETTHLTKDGRIFPVEITVNYVKFGDKEYNCAFAKDITERKKAEENLKHESKIRETLLDNLPCIALILKKGTREIVASNKIAKEIGAIPGTTCYGTCADRDDQCGFCLAPEVWATNERREIEVEYRGTWYRGIWVPLTEDQYVHYIFDITERKKAEEKLQEKQRLNEQLLDSLPHAAMLINKDKIVVAANKIALDVGTKIGDYCWKEFGKCACLSEENKKRAENDPNTKGIKCTFCLADQCLNNNKYLNDPEVSAFDRLWDTYWVPIDNEIYLHYAIDITERKHLEEQLQIRQRMDSLGTLAGGIAHDFNNILAGIMGNLSLINMHTGNLTEDQKECLNDAEQSCDRAANLISQFQTLSRASVTGKSAVDIYDISKEVFSLLKKTTDRLIDKQISFKKGEFYVHANPGEIHQALLNLAMNSSHAIEEKGAKIGDYIRISAEDYNAAPGDRTGLQEGDYIHISFEDTGAGMPEEVLKKAFDPLFTTKGLGVKKGQGLGLAMVYNIVTRIYKGHIYIDSEEGKGTTFHIYLPKAQPEVEDESKRIIEMIGGTETILVVDDEETIRKMTFKLLTQIGFTVLTANDGKGALEIYKKRKDSIDVVILDLTMPQMSGKQVFQMMLDINPDVKIIISSGHGEEYSKEGILAHAKGNVGKPYKLKDLVNIVRGVLDS